MSKRIILIFLALVVLLLAGGFYVLKLKNKPKEVASSATPAKEAEKNYYEINDELAGVSFKIGKKFDRMPVQQLQIKNPNFIYGFLAKDDANVSCFISQTKRENPGIVKVSQLRDGVFGQLKESNPGAKMEEAGIIDIGENNNKGAKLKMSYAEADKNPMIQWEVAGITDKTATFALCNAPKAVLDLYEEDFELFLESVRIK